MLRNKDEINFVSDLSTYYDREQEEASHQSEDSNAENHYSNDYPEDESEERGIDDEFRMDTYGYRHGRDGFYDYYGSEEAGDIERDDDW
ncbi:hypothetical protein L596_015407 [Steinernema carpocapsae]|uniref:Transcription factor Iwr1 domain-containing protein n=1 Tax=Steinernema carpocapsae TaxID=34508 RepID=A0A4U5NFG9_STECR|nr:hypothetical protein L596_015407 [Steinernema carpocapsae]